MGTSFCSASQFPLRPTAKAGFSPHPGPASCPSQPWATRRVRDRSNIGRVPPAQGGAVTSTLLWVLPLGIFLEILQNPFESYQLTPCLPGQLLATLQQSSRLFQFKSFQCGDNLHLNVTGL